MNTHKVPRIGLVLLVEVSALGAMVFTALPASAAPTTPGPVAQLPPPGYAQAEASGNWSPTPDGLAYDACVYQVPNGAEISADGVVTVGGLVVETASTCPYSGLVPYPSNPLGSNQANSTTTNTSASTSPVSGGGVAPAQIPLPNTAPKGWWAASTANTAQVTDFSAQWVVPANPVATGNQLVYMFPSVQPASMTYIVQPVLQWGQYYNQMKNIRLGGNKWIVANWYVAPGDDVFISSSQDTVTGHTISGDMYRSSGTSGSWAVSFTDLTTGFGSGFGIASSVISWTTVQGGVLEVYGATSCDQVSSSGQVTFSNIKLTTTNGVATPQFTLLRPNDAYSATPCGANATWTGSTTTVSWATPSDVPTTDQYYSDIIWLYNNGITSGTSSTTFTPHAAVTRQQMAEFLYRTAGSPAYTPPATSPFTDVPTSSQYYKAIAWLRARGITTVTTFSPTVDTPRQQMAAFLYRFAGSPTYTPPTVSPFTDVPTSSDYYKEIAWLHSKGVSTVATFSPTASIPRNQMAAMLRRMGTGKLYCAVYPGYVDQFGVHMGGAGC